MSKYLPHHRDHDFDSRTESDGFWRAVVDCVILIFFMGMLCLFGVEASFNEAQNQERYYSKPVTVTYEKPAAYRLQSPTMEQMDKLHDMQRIAEVSR